MLNSPNNIKRLYDRQWEELPIRSLEWDAETFPVSLFHFCFCAKKSGTQLTLHTLTSEGIFSILFSIHSLRFWQGEFVSESTASLVDDHFLYSSDLSVWLRGRTVTLTLFFNFYCRGIWLDQMIYYTLRIFVPDLVVFQSMFCGERAGKLKDLASL